MRFVDFFYRFFSHRGGSLSIASCEIASECVRCDIERGVSLIYAPIRWQRRSFVGIAVRPIGGRELSSQPASQPAQHHITHPATQPASQTLHTHSQRPSHITRPWRGLLIPLHYKFTPFRPLLRVAFLVPALIRVLGWVSEGVCRDRLYDPLEFISDVSRSRVHLLYSSSFRNGWMSELSILVSCRRVTGCGCVRHDGWIHEQSRSLRGTMIVLERWRCFLLFSVFIFRATLLRSSRFNLIEQLSSPFIPFLPPIKPSH